MALFGSGVVLQVPFGQSQFAGATPVIITPTPGATNVPVADPLVLTTQPNVTTPSLPKNAAWAIYTGAGGTGSLIWSDTTRGPTVLTDTVPGGTLTTNTTYYLRVTFHGKGYKNSTTESSFTTGAS